MGCGSTSLSVARVLRSVKSTSLKKIKKKKKSTSLRVHNALHGYSVYSLCAQCPTKSLGLFQ